MAHRASTPIRRDLTPALIALAARAETVLERALPAAVAPARGNGPGRDGDFVPAARAKVPAELKMFVDAKLLGTTTVGKQNEMFDAAKAIYK